MPAVYDIRTSPEGMLAWSWARERLANSHNYVVVTVRPNGRPHAMGMHGVWFEDAYYFSTGDTTRKAKNLEQNAHSIVINERLDELVIVEGGNGNASCERSAEGARDGIQEEIWMGARPARRRI